MDTNILRNFYYMDSETIDNYLSSINGEIYDSEERSEKFLNKKGVDGGISSLIKINAGLQSQIETETRKKIIQTYAGKFQKIYSYLEQNGSIPFFDCIDDENWNAISRNQFIEILVSLRFSKMDTLVYSFSNFLPMLEGIDQSLIEDDAKKTLYFMQMFNEINKQNGLPAELQLINGSKYKFVTHFDQNCFLVNIDSIPNEVTVLAKIQRKLKENEKINLINIIPMLEKMAINREMRRNMKHSINELPEELSDNIKGPGALIIPIAIYN